MTWRTMESAPRDGTYVLLRMPGYALAEVCCWASGRDRWQDVMGDYVNEPTHWQPLPSTDLTAPCPVVEARIQGLREGMEIAQDNACAEPANLGDCPDINWDDADAALLAAIAELREGKR
jgi:hypothetical protein